MHDGVSVRVLEALRDLRREVRGQRVIQSALLAQHAVQRLPFQQLHGDERDLALHADVVDRHQVGVAEAPGRLRLAQEALAHGAQHVFRQARTQRLDRHRALDQGIDCAVHRAGRAAPELSDDAVTTERFGRHRVLFSGRAAEWRNDRP